MARPGQRLQCADLGTAVLADQVGGDAVQPGAGQPVGGVVAVPGTERDEERLRRDVVRRALPEAAGGVAVDVRGVPVVQPGEQFGLVEGVRDDVGVVFVFAFGVEVGRRGPVTAPPGGASVGVAVTPVVRSGRKGSRALHQLCRCF